MILVASSLSLLAIVAGMFLYAKTIKEELNRLFKIVAFFIIIVGFLNLFVGSAFFIVRKIYLIGVHFHNRENCAYGQYGHMKGHGCDYMSGEGMNCENYDDNGRNWHHNEMRMDGGTGCCSSMMDMKGMKEMMNEKSCSMKGNMMMKKDSIMNKK